VMIVAAAEPSAHGCTDQQEQLVDGVPAHPSHRAHIARHKFCTDPQRNPENRQGKYLERMRLRSPIYSSPSKDSTQTVERAEHAVPVNAPLTDWEDHRSRPWRDTALHREPSPFP